MNIFSDEIKNRVRSIYSKSDNIITTNTINETEWKKLSKREQTHVLKGYGLHNFYYDAKYDSYPSWVMQGKFILTMF